MVKEPLVSYFGDFRADAYTEEYGMHTGIDWMGFIPIIVFGIIEICSADGDEKSVAILNVIVSVLLWLMTQLFMRHMGRTTIQKGFKYYLGWQMIICWSHPNIGLKNLWMEVYDSDIEESTQKGVWSDNKATRKDNPAGIVAHIDKPDMFGGVDEGGGFVGDIRVYFGGDGNTHDSWMVQQMSLDTVQEEVRGLTPLYTPYMSVVVPQAYIGKQSNIPSMWFEIVNYPDALAIMYADKLKEDYETEKKELDDKIKKIEDIEESKRTIAQKSNLASYKTEKEALDKRGALHLGKISEDLNPAEAIYEICVNNDWGCAIDKDKIDIDSLYELGKTCEKEGMGVSVQISSVTPAKTVIGNILSHINGMFFDNPKTGKLAFKLIRNDYDENSLITLSVDNCESCEFSRLDWSETASSVTASFTDCDNKYETSTLPVYDLANVKITKTITDKQIDAGYFTTSANAKTYAQNELLSAGYPLAAASIKANRVAHNLTVGQPFILNWEPYGVKKTIMRVTDIDYAGLKDGIISIEAIEDVFSFDKTVYAFSNGSEWKDVDHLPEVVTNKKFIESPYEMNNTLDTFVYAMAVNPSAYSVYWDVWRNKDGSYYISAKSSNWTAGARMVYGTDANYISDDKFEVKELGSVPLFDDRIELINKKPELYNNTTGRNIAIIDNEIVSYNNIVKMPNGNYSIEGIIRGIYDTIPVIHTSSSIIYLMDNMLNITGDSIDVEEGKNTVESLCITTESTDKQSALDETTAYNMTTTRRAEQPSVMANLKFGADCGDNTVYLYDNTKTLSNDLRFKFNQRDKFKTYNIVTQTDTTYRGIDIVANTNTKNVVRATLGDKTKEYFYDAYEKDNFVLSWGNICNDFDVHDTNVFNLEIGTYDNDKKLYSNQMYQKQIDLVVPVMVEIVRTKAQAQALADNMVDSNYIIVEESHYNVSRTIMYELCPLIATYSYTTTVNPDGTEVYTPDSGIIMGRDGVKYNLTPTYYRIVGRDSDGKAILYEEKMDDRYILKMFYNSKTNNTEQYFRYNSSGSWSEITVEE